MSNKRWFQSSNTRLFVWSAAEPSLIPSINRSVIPLCQLLSSWLHKKEIHRAQSTRQRSSRTRNSTATISLSSTIGAAIPLINQLFVIKSHLNCTAVIPVGDNPGNITVSTSSVLCSAYLWLHVYSVPVPPLPNDFYLRIEQQIFVMSIPFRVKTRTLPKFWVSC